MKKIAFYGKGGIGKSTTVSNLASALARQGYGGERIPTILDVVRQGGGDDERDFLRISPSGVYCMEAGGPLPGTGCAGRGIIAAFEKLDELDVYEKYRPDFVLYDVLGDVVCGGFAMPLRSGYADELYIVTSGEMMSLYAASNIAQAVRNLRASGCAKLKGLILNKKNIEAEEELAEKAAREMETEIAFILPRDPMVQRAEALRKTVVDAFPDCEMSGLYARLAERIAHA